jgi:ribokinase
MPRIVVVGSANVDIVVATERLPVPGETVLGGTLLINHGGKGANQAVAARRLGAEVRFIGCVGDDAFGTAMCQGLAAQGLDVMGVETVPGVATGTAVVVVDAAGHNQIAVASGANLHLTAERAARYTNAVTWADVVLCQLEVPLDTVLWTLRTAHTHGVTTILNPAPAQPLPAAIWSLIDYLTPNAIEAAHLSGLPVTESHNVEEVGRTLMAQGPRAVMVTLGEQGVYVYTAGRPRMVAALPVTAVDTTAAGDAFNGALAVAIAEGQELDAAVHFANVAAALTCTRHGAQDALPDRTQVEALLTAR